VQQLAAEMYSAFDVDKEIIACCHTPIFDLRHHWHASS